MGMNYNNPVFYMMNMSEERDACIIPYEEYQQEISGYFKYPFLHLTLKNCANINKDEFYIIRDIIIIHEKSN